MITAVATQLEGQAPASVRRSSGTVIGRRFRLVCGLAAYAVALHWTYQAWA